MRRAAKSSPQRAKVNGHSAGFSRVVNHSLPAWTASDTLPFVYGLAGFLVAVRPAMGDLGDMLLFGSLVLASEEVGILVGFVTIFWGFGGMVLVRGKGARAQNAAQRQNGNDADHEMLCCSHRRSPCLLHSACH